MKFYGNVGYRVDEEVRPSVWKPTITERPYYGDIIRLTRRISSSDKINADITIENQISIVSDPFALEHFQNIIYVWWMGTTFVVSRVEVQFPRLILTIGDIYNGDKPA